MSCCCPLPPLPSLVGFQVSIERCMPVGEDEGTGTAQVCSWEEECVEAFILRGFKDWGFREGLGEDLKRILISFMLMYQNEIHSLDFICPWVWLAHALIGFLLCSS